MLCKYFSKSYIITKTYHTKCNLCNIFTNPNTDKLFPNLKITKLFPNLKITKLFANHIYYLSLSKQNVI